MQPEVYLTDEVVVSASRKTQSLSLAPASVGIVDRVDLQQNGIRSFDDAFHNINGIQVTRSSGSNVQALSIRGASEIAGGGIGNRVLLLLDGRPAITPESGGALWNLVPLGAIERIEVIKGAYSSLFGSSAMGGVINVITRIPDSVPHTDLHAH
jgi:outer membrane receptor for ferrienterochelin and colicin